MGGSEGSAPRTSDTAAVAGHRLEHLENGDRWRAGTQLFHEEATSGDISAGLEAESERGGQGPLVQQLGPGTYALVLQLSQGWSKLSVLLSSMILASQL